MLPKLTFRRRRSNISEYSVHYGATGIIFILSGMSLNTTVLGKTLLQWKIHLVTQVLSLGVYPLVGFAMGRILIALGYNSILAKGITLAMSTPTTIASNVTMTRRAGGNEPAALTNAVLGNIIGVFLSPILIIAYTGEFGVDWIAYISYPLFDVIFSSHRCVTCDCFQSSF